MTQVTRVSGALSWLSRLAGRLPAVAALLFAAGAAPACDREALDSGGSAAVELIGWHALGTWSGRGHKQTESFTSDASALRVHWEATNADPAGSGFQLTIHSAISGRPLEQIVDHAGAGEGTAYLYEDPRVFHAVVDSHGVDWTFTVEEAVVGAVAGPGDRGPGGEER